MAVIQMNKSQGALEDEEAAALTSISQLVGAILALLLVVVAVVAYFTYRWLLNRLQSSSSASDSDAALVTGRKSPTPSTTASLKISHSLPDIKDASCEDFCPEVRKSNRPLRQTTLPAVPSRHETFQRQLSHRLELADVPFEVYTIHQREGMSVGKIKPELYKPELVRQESSESTGAVAESVCCGKLHFTLKYDQDFEGLVVKVVQAQELPVKDLTGSSDPYVKLYLLPDRKKRFQTRVHRRDLNPAFNETFMFSVPYDELHTRTLQFSVYDFDRFTRNDLIGHVLVKGLSDLCDVAHEMEYIMDIISVPSDKMDRGELMLSLCYLPAAGRLTVTVIKARHLKVMDVTGSSDPYVKVSLMCQGKRIKKKKTTVKKSTLNPVYNEALVFDVPAESIEHVTLAIKVLDYDRVGSNELLGCCAIGSNCIGQGRDRWLEMLEFPRKPVAQWYPLTEALPPMQEEPKCINGR